MLAHGALLAVALIYGANYIIAKGVMQDGILSPKAFISFRVGFGLIAFWLVHTLWIKERIERKDVPRLILCGLFGIALNQLFFFMGLEKTTPIHASLLMVTNPILVFILSAIILKERISFLKSAGIILGLGGTVSLLLADQRIGFSGDTLVGDLMVWFNASCYALYLVLVKPLMKRYHPFTVVKWSFTFGALIVFPVSFTELQTVDLSLIQGKYIWQVVYVLLGTTFLAYALNAFALKTVTPTVVSIYIYLQPLIAATLSVLMGWEAITGLKVFAATMIFAGVFMVSRKKKQKLSQTDKG